MRFYQEFDVNMSVCDSINMHAQLCALLSGQITSYVCVAVHRVV